MFTVNYDELTIHVNRGDIVFFSVSAIDQDGSAYKFKEGDLVKFKVMEKKNAANVLLEVKFPVYEAKDSVEIFLRDKDTKFGDIISKPTDYWYEVELINDTGTQTIIGYDEDGAKIFRLYPEGGDIFEGV